MKFPSVLLLISLLSAPLFLQLGCSSTEENLDNPAELYQEAEDDIDSDRYMIAIEKLQKLKDRFAYSKYAALAQLKIADVYFLQDNFLQAAASYETFRDLHPKHEKVAYATYRIAESYFMDIPGTIARDLSSADSALTAYENYLTKFPTDDRVADAKKRIGEIRKTLAQKELYIGNFYLNEDQYLSAKGRFKKTIEYFPETEEATEAKERLTDTEEGLKETASQ